METAERENSEFYWERMMYDTSACKDGNAYAVVVKTANLDERK